MGGGRTGAAIVAAVLLAGLPAAPAGSAPDGGALVAQSGREQGLISRDEAAAAARRATGGRVLRVELRGDGRPWYRVKLLVDGERVRSVRIDARNGRVLD